MAIKITGKNLDLGESLRAYISERLDAALDKYAGKSLSGQVSVEKYNDGFTTHFDVHMTSGFDMQSSAQGVDAYASVDSAIDKLEKRLRRYKRRLKNHGQGNNAASFADAAGVDYVIDPEKTSDHDSDDKEHGHAAAVIAERPYRMKAMSVSDAVMQLDLAEQPFLLFRNAANGDLNVVYRRQDGNIGWIDPNSGLKSGKS
jgi:ribosomal subunit interface protein